MGREQDLSPLCEPVEVYAARRHLSISTVRRRIQNGTLKTVRFGRLVRVVVNPAEFAAADVQGPAVERAGRAVQVRG